MDHNKNIGEKEIYKKMEHRAKKEIVTNQN